jgi:hypothetical protein
LIIDRSFYSRCDRTRYFSKKRYFFNITAKNAETAKKAIPHHLAKGAKVLFEAIFERGESYAR